MQRRTREEINELRDVAIRAMEGDQESAQEMWDMFGLLNKDQFEGVVVGLSVWLRETD
jgi:hypothetical protein